MEALPATGKAEFLTRYGHIFEHSPWVVERAFARRPPADAAALHDAFMAEVRAAGADEQLALIGAHPELASGVALTEASRTEQLGAGLRQLTQQEYDRFAALNGAYRKKFGFPFIICVRLNSRDDILTAFEARLHNDAEREKREALLQIGLIASLRLQDMFEGAMG